MPYTSGNFSSTVSNEERNEYQSSTQIDESPEIKEQTTEGNTKDWYYGTEELDTWCFICADRLCCDRLPLGDALEGR
jgi:hypothetical protein